MVRPPALTESQRKVLREDEPRLRACVATGDFSAAKRIAARIQRLLRQTGHTTRWMQNLNWLCECAIEAGELAFSIQRLESVRAVMRPTTRIHLEATGLLAIALIRSGESQKAQSFVAEVIERVNTIKSPGRRRQFHKRFIRRIEEESILAGLRSESSIREVDVDIVQEEAIRLQVLSVPEIEAYLGRAVPQESVLLLTGMREHAIRRLPPADRKYLPSASEVVRPRQLGERARSSLRRIVWRAVCDPEDELYKAWSGAVSAVYDKKWIAAAVVAALKAWEITLVGLAISLVALAFKLGVRVFCELFAPEPLMISLRDRS